MNTRRYLAILREQQRRLEALARSQGAVPLRRNYDALIADITKVSGSGKVDAAGQREILTRTRQAMTQFIRVGSGVLDQAAAHIVTATAGQAFNVVAALEKDRTGRSLVVSDRGRDAIASAGPKPSTLIGAHERSLARYGAHVVIRVQEQIGTGIAIGETHTEILDRVMRTADMEWYQADRIVRTELSYAGNSAARAAIGKEHEILGDVFSQWTENADEDGRPLDEIVCVDSLALHGQIAALGESFIMPPTSVYPDARGRTEVPEKMIGKTWDHPPNRPNDRSVIGPWRPHWATPGWRWENSRRIDKRRKLEDASRDIGKVSDEEKAAARRVQERSATALAATQGQGTRELGGRARQPRDRPAVPGAAPQPATPTTQVPASRPPPAPRPPPATGPAPTQSPARPATQPRPTPAAASAPAVAPVSAVPAARQQDRAALPATKPSVASAAASRVSAEKLQAFAQKMERELIKRAVLMGIGQAYVLTRRQRSKRTSAPMLQVETRDGDPVATFGLAGSRVIAVWHDDNYQSAVERDGIRGEYGIVRPVDGELFFDALMGAYPDNGPLRVVEVGGVSRT